MHNDGFLSYDRASLDMAINEAKSLSNIVNNSLSVKYGSLKNSIPQGFSPRAASSLIGVINGLSSGGCSNQKLLYVEEFLKKTKDEAEKHVGSMSSSSSGSIPSSYEFVNIDGQEGYLYIPENFSKNDRLPIITYLNGMYETSANKVNSRGLSKAINEGVNLNAVVWVPVNDTAWHYDSNSLDKTANSINHLIKEYNLNPNKNILMGYSSGAYAGFDYVSEHPGYFSSFVSFGAAPKSENQQYVQQITDGLANSGTEIIMYTGMNDSSCSWYGEQVFNQVNEKGGNIKLYQVDGADHGYDHGNMINNQLLDEIFTVERGKNNFPIDNGTITKVSLSEVERTSIMNPENSSNKNSQKKVNYIIN